MPGGPGMSWFALSGQDESWIAPGMDGDESDALAVCGSIVIEARVPLLRRPRPLVVFERQGDWPIYLSIQALPGGGVTVILDQGGVIAHRVFDVAEGGRAENLRITYAWNGPARTGRIALENPDTGETRIAEVPAPRPIRLCDLAALMRPSSCRYLSPEVVYLAASERMEPVGPMPTLLPDTPVATPDGSRRAGQLRRGDLVITASGLSVPVLHLISRTVPARGSFVPVRLRAPFFGLRQDIAVCALQGIVLSGSEVEYLFGKETVLMRTGDLLGGHAVQPVNCGRFIRYVQPLLPENEPIKVAGAALDSLAIGRIRRKPVPLAASLLAPLSRNTLPEHIPQSHAVLRAQEAAMLADYRAA